MTRLLILLQVAILGVLPYGVLAADPVPANACHAIFRGTSTLHDFEGSVDASVVETRSDSKGWSLRIECAIAGMNTRNDARDRNMRRMFEYPKFPIIVATGHDLPWPMTGMVARLPMTLNILDHERSGVAVLENWSFKNGVATFTLKGAVSLADFGLKPPGALLGMIRVGDRVELEGRITLYNWQK